MIEIIILTSSRKGTASYQLRQLLNQKEFLIKRVILSNGEIKNKKKYFKRKYLKFLKIGIFGVLNGFRMRKWYSKDINKYIDIEDIEKICKSNEIPFTFTPTINCKTTIHAFKNANADLGISLGNGYIPSKIFDIPKFGMINIHHEILPNYQNAQSIIWQLYNNSKITGYTIHKINKSIDTGEILYSEQIPIYIRDSLADTVSFSYAFVIKKSSQGLIKVLYDFDKFYNNKKVQGNGDNYTTPNLFQFILILRNFIKIKKEIKPRKNN